VLRVVSGYKGGDMAMGKLLRALVAGWGARQAGCGCFGTVILFLFLWWLLGHFSIFQ